MTKKDQQLLAEAYQQIDEGILRRAGSNIAGGLKKLKGVPGAIGGKAVELGGKAVGAAGRKFGSETAETIGAEFQQSGQDTMTAAKAKGAGGKEEHFKTSLLAEIEKDVQSLGVVKDVKGFMAAITNVLDTHIPSGEQSFVSAKVGAQSPVTVTNPPAREREKSTKLQPAPSPSSSGQAKLGPAFQRQAAPAKKKRPRKKRTRAQKDRENQLARERRAKDKAAAKKPGKE